ncbi:sulfurtransferase [Chryseobacterium suipulveris]|uniref:Sulfurtransferase n=1 Tax=Chryseobacterium suipulveris TaxID=2929800 RepID=A0ABY4BSZ6_9FLAO|nr:sulfurtransferase [Chryseobacterium suipulveris]UOE41327.1 sulfurtransferase [Chryseobacterium suipulveris]
MRNSSVITAQDLKELFSRENLVILDARTGKDAYQSYLEKHIKSARFVDLDKDLAHIGTNAAFDGRHPLPSPKDFVEVLSELGVHENSKVIVYDLANGANAAARCWWMLKAAGIDASVLSGGLQHAEKAGVEMSSGTETFPKAERISLENWKLPTITIDEVEAGLRNKTAAVIDVRDAYRYKGESEPIDLIAGHIPGAENIPFSENLDDEGLFLSPEILHKKYSDFLSGKTADLAIHCGSGVTACHTILAMDYAGLEIPKLYVGSWSEWSRRGKEIAKGLT